MAISMIKRTNRHIDWYSELCPTISGMVMGAGVVIGLIESLYAGLGCFATGVAIGIVLPIMKPAHSHKKFKREL